MRHTLPDVCSGRSSLLVEALEGRDLLSVSPAANLRPSIGGLAIIPSSVAPGGTIALVASAVSDPEGAVAKVEFYRDTNGNKIFDKLVDQQIGLDGSPRKGWNFYYATTGLTSGSYTFFARTRDALGEVSKPAAATCTITGGKINLVGQYDGTIRFDGDGSDTLRINITSQDGQKYFYGTFLQVGSGVQCSVTGTFLRNNGISLVFSGDVTGSANGSLSADGNTMSGRFSSRYAGHTYTGTFSVKR